MPKNLYEFVATGQGDVIKAYESIGAAAERQKKQVEGAAKATARSRGAGGGVAGGAQRSRYDDELQKETRAQAAAEARRRSAEDRASRAKAKQEERAQRHVAGIKERHFREQQRAEERQDATQQRAAGQRHRREQSAAAKRSKELARESETNRTKVIEGIAGAVTGVAVGAAITSAATAVAATREIQALDERARDISIAARKSGQGFLDKDALRRGFQATATATPGVKSEDVAAAVAKFVQMTGDVQTGLRGQGVFATVASATGASAEDAAAATAALSQNFDITSLEDMKEAMAALAFQGKEGAVELRDMASLFQQVAVAGKTFGLNSGLGGVRMLGGFLQVAKLGTKSPEAAATAMEQVFASFKEKQEDLSAAGVQVYDRKTGALRTDFPTLLAETIAKVGGADMAKKQSGLSKLFGTEGGRGVAPLVAAYMEAYNTTGGDSAAKSAAGMDAVIRKLTDAANAAGSYADLQKDAAERQKDASAQLTGSWEALKMAVDGPAMRAVEGLGGAAGWLAMFLQSAAKDLEQVDAKKTGGKAEADAARAEVWQMEGIMSAAGIDESQLSPENAERLRAAREIRDKFDAKAARAEQFKADLAAGKQPVAWDGGGALEQFTNRYADELVAVGYEDNLESAKSRSADIGRRMIEGGGELGVLDRLNLPAMESMEMAAARADLAKSLGAGPADKVKIDTAPANEALSEFQKNVSAANAALAMMGTIFG